MKILRSVYIFYVQIMHVAKCYFDDSQDCIDRPYPETNDVSCKLEINAIEKCFDTSHVI